MTPAASSPILDTTDNRPFSYRPLLHFAPPGGWLNDPNGLVYRDGWWHLFYQHFPGALAHGPMHWGHAISKDLIEWTNRDIALSPDHNGNIWSGSAVNLPEGILACFTHQTPERQAQSYALSVNGGETFTMDAANPILQSDLKDFRDPKLFRHGPQWRMLVAAGEKAQLWGSGNLRDWELLSEILAPHPAWVWECPDLFELNGEWVLLASFVVPRDPHETLYWVGTFDGDQFVAAGPPRKLSFGPDDYAAITWNDAPAGRRVAIGWMSNWQYAALTPTERDGFRGVMTMPRELRLVDGQLLQSPVAELTNHRVERWPLNSLVPGNTMSVNGPALEIVAEIEIGRSPHCGLRIRSGEGEFTEVGYRTKNQELYVDRSLSGQVDFHHQFRQSFSTAVCLPGLTLKLHIVVDACSIEVFGQGGDTYAASLIFPTSEVRNVEFFGEGARLVSGEIFRLSC